MIQSVDSGSGNFASSNASPKLMVPADSSARVYLDRDVMTGNLTAPVTTVTYLDLTINGKVMIPAGSRLIGRCQNISGNRIEMSFDGTIFPNGREYAVDGMALGEDNLVGVPGNVDRNIVGKTGNLFASSVLDATARTLNVTGDSFSTIFAGNMAYCFSVGDAQKKLGIAQNNVVKILSRLKRKHKIISLSKGLYAYFPPAERKHGFNVITAIDQIMAYWRIPYYVGLLSAANHYGAAHYKPQVLQVIIPKQISFRKAKGLGISFHVKKHFPKYGLARVKTPSGYVFYATPEMLVLDLLDYEKASGGIENATLVIHDILSLLKSKDLQEVARRYPTIAAIQRLGYILERLGAKSALLNAVTRVLRARGTSVVKLSAVMPSKGKHETKWNIIQNIAAEIDDDI